MLASGEGSLPSEIPAEIPSQVGKHRDAGRYVLGDAARPLVQRWMAFRISSVESPFATYPRAPARSIERTVSQSSCAESAITRVEGERRRISRVALCPPPPGMRTSRSATSGNSVRATSIACGVKKFDRGRDLERVARIPCRSRWSSAGSDRHLIMELGPVDTSGTGVGEIPTEGCQRHVR